MGAVSAGDQTPQGEWDRSYEVKAIVLLSIGFGLVGLDRFIIYPLFPVMAEDLGLSLQDQGLIAGVLALTWGLSSIFAGNLTDRIGMKKVLVGSVIGFSILVAMSGLATGLITLLIIRAVMGFAEGGFVPSSIVATVDASKPSRIGMNVGIQQMAMPFFGLFLGPLVAVGLLMVLPSWHYVFAVLALPGFVLAWFLSRNIRSRGAEPKAEIPTAEARPAPSLWAPYKYQNIAVVTAGMICFFITLHVMSAFMPVYSTDYLGLSMEQMGGLMAALGGGGLVGMVLVPGVSDKVGRKPTIVASLAIVCLVFALWVGTGTTNPLTIAACLFLISLFNSGVVA
ncbi:MAG: MFS transporter, partial [Pseudomonadota bacterium]